MATTVKLTTVNAINTAVALEGYTTPTQSTAGKAELFGAAIQAADGKGFFVIDNASGSCDLTVSLSAGDYVGAADTAPVTVVKGSTAFIFADSAACKTKDGLLTVSVTPAQGVALSGCGAKLAAVQFLPVINY